MNFEINIIYVLLNNPVQVLKCELSASDFSSTTLAEAFQIMKILVTNGEHIDLPVIIEKMKAPDAVDVMMNVYRNGLGDIKNLKVYVKAIVDLSLRKKLRGFLEESINTLAESTTDEVIGQLTTKLSSLKNKDVDHSYNGKQMMQKTIEHIEEMYDLKNQDRMAGIPSGLDKLDKELGGLHKSDLIIVGARPAMGKTAFAISCALNASKRGFKVGFISTEMGIVQVGMRVASSISEIPASVMRDSDFDDNDWPRLTAGTKRISELPFYIFDKPVCKVSDIAIQARAWKENDGLDILYVDYLTRIKPESSAENKTIAIGNIATDLKTLARTLDIPVVVLAQVSRLVEKRDDKRPTMGDLRDSGVIEQEADQVLMLYRDCIYNRTDNNSEDAEVNIEKNRHGAVKGLNMRFKPTTMEWCDREDFNDYEYH